MDAFIRTLARDGEAHGEEVIKRVRAENPLAHFKAMLSLLPKDVSLKTQTEQTPLDRFPATQALIDQVIGERKAQGAALVKNSPKTMV
jgi:hypothetical protein